MWLVSTRRWRRNALRLWAPAVRFGAIVVVGCGLGSWNCRFCSAAEITFMLDPASSQVTASAVIAPLDSPMSQQGSGSTVASYSGTFTVDVDDLVAPKTIQFLGGSAAAAVTGNWLPEVGGGSPGSFLPGDADPGTAEPANYGLTVSQPVVGTLWLAFRDLVLSPTSGPLPLTDGAFAADQTFALESGSADYAARSVFFGDRNATEQLAGDTIENMAETAGTYSVEDGLATLQLPIELFDMFADESSGATLLELNFSGSITARAMLAPTFTADVDGDGDVDGRDLLEMLLGFGTNGGATRSDGDADLDGNVDRSDVDMWRQQVGSGIDESAGGTAVPEPNGSILALASAGLLLAARKRAPRRQEPAGS
jgi:hypothetical protein